MNYRASAPLNNIIIFGIIGIVAILMGKIITDTSSYILPILCISAILMLFVSFIRLEWAIVLLIYAMLLSPELILGSVSSNREITIRIEDIFLVIFSFLWLARAALHKKVQFLRKTPMNKYLAFYTITFVFATLKGMLTNDVRPVQGTFYILKYLEYFIIYFLVVGILKNRKQAVMYIKAFIITFAIVNIYAFTQIGLGGRVSAPFEGPVGEPNTLGGYQVLLFGVIIGLLSHMSRSKWRWLMALLCVFSFIPFAYTLSRSSYMSLVPTYLVLVYFNRSRKRNILIGSLFIVLILSFFFFPKNVKERIMYTFVPQQQQYIDPVKVFGVKLGPSASARFKSWEYAIRFWLKRPVLGYGVTGKGFLDSQFVRTFVELGSLGFIAFLLLLIGVYRNTLRIYHNTNDGLFKGLALGFLAGHIGMIMHALTANTFIIIRIMEPYWFLLGIVMMIPEIDKNEKEKEKDKLTKTVTVDNIRWRSHMNLKNI